MTWIMHESESTQCSVALPVASSTTTSISCRTNRTNTTGTTSTGSSTLVYEFGLSDSDYLKLQLEGIEFGLSRFEKFVTEHSMEMKTGRSQRCTSTTTGSSIVVTLVIVILEK